jgi:hypothetical protein
MEDSSYFILLQFGMNGFGLDTIAAKLDYQYGVPQLYVDESMLIPVESVAHLIPDPVNRGVELPLFPTSISPEGLVLKSWAYTRIRIKPSWLPPTYEEIVRRVGSKNIPFVHKDLMKVYLKAYIRWLLS